MEQERSEDDIQGILEPIDPEPMTVDKSKGDLSNARESASSAPLLEAAGAGGITGAGEKGSQAEVPEEIPGGKKVLENSAANNPKMPPTANTDDPAKETYAGNNSVVHELKPKRERASEPGPDNTHAGSPGFGHDDRGKKTGT